MDLLYGSLPHRSSLGGDCAIISLNYNKRFLNDCLIGRYFEVGTYHATNHRPQWTQWTLSLSVSNATAALPENVYWIADRFAYILYRFISYAFHFIFGMACYVLLPLLPRTPPPYVAHPKPTHLIISHGYIEEACKVRFNDVHCSHRA